MNTSDRFKKFDKEFLKFENIPEPDRLHRLRDLCGMMYLMYLAKVQPGIKCRIIAGAEHDVVHFDGDAEKLTDDDILYLTRCGIRYGEFGLECFA